MLYSNNNNGSFISTYVPSSWCTDNWPVIMTVVISIPYSWFFYLSCELDMSQLMITLHAVIVMQSQLRTLHFARWDVLSRSTSCRQLPFDKLTNFTNYCTHNLHLTGPLCVTDKGVLVGGEFRRVLQAITVATWCPLSGCWWSVLLSNEMFLGRCIMYVPVCCIWFIAWWLDSFDYFIDRWFHSKGYCNHNSFPSFWQLLCAQAVKITSAVDNRASLISINLWGNLNLTTRNHGIRFRFCSCNYVYVRNTIVLTQINKSIRPVII